MVKEYEAPIRTYPYPFELVVEAYHRRYPKCDLIPELIETQITYDFESDDKSLRVTERRFKTAFDIPMILKKISGIDFIYFIGRNSLNLIDRTLLIETRNETFSSRATGFETCRYSVCPTNPNHTIFEQKAILEIKSFFGFDNLAEKVCIRSYTKTFNKTESLIHKFIELLASEGVSHVPIFAACIRSPSLSAHISVDEITYRNPLTPKIGSTNMDDFYHDSPIEDSSGGDKNLSNFDDDPFKKYLPTLPILERNSLLILRKKMTLREDDIPQLTLILRFLRSTEGNVDKAYELIVKHLNWRRQNSIDYIMMWNIPPNVAPWFLGQWLNGDSNDSPLYCIRLGVMDIKGLIKSIGLDGIAKSVIKICEEGLKRCEQMSIEAGKPILSWSLICDLHDLTLKQAWRPILQTFLRLIEMLQINYPESLNRVILVRPPRFFVLIWALISVMITEESKKKFIIISSDCFNKNKLLNVLPVEKIPLFLGGSLKTDIEKDLDTPIPSSMYQYCDEFSSSFMGTIKVNDLFKKIVIHKSHVIEVNPEMSHGECLITWDFDVLEGDVTFCLYTISKSTLGSMVNLITASYQNLDKIEGMEPILYRAGSSVQGCHYCDMPITYALHWVCDADVNKSRKSIIILNHEMVNHNHLKSSINSLRSSLSNVSAIDQFSLNSENLSIHNANLN